MEQQDEGAGPGSGTGSGLDAGRVAAAGCGAAGSGVDDALGRLAGLRQRIDAADDALVDLLARRFALTRAVGQIKAEGGLAARDDAREAAQQARLAALATARGVDPGLVLDIFHAVVARVVAEHEAMGAPAAGAPDPIAGAPIPAAGAPDPTAPGSPGQAGWR